MLLQGKTAVVTGGSRGIGLAIVKRFLEEGANVALCGSRPETAQKGVEAILAKIPNAPVMGISPDITNESELEAAFREVAGHFGSLDIIVNNAGISQSTPLGDYTPEEFDRIIDTNVKGVLNGCQAAARTLGEGGVILNTSSMVSKNGQPSGVGYPMSKFAVNGITVSLARELGPLGIRVNAVAPGVTATDMVAALPEEMIKPIADAIPIRRVGQPSGVGYPMSKFAVNGITVSLARELGPLGIRVNAVAPGVTATDMVAALPEEMIKPIADAIPIRRVGQPEDVANAFVFLASDLASYITGAVLPVDGGMTV